MTISDNLRTDLLTDMDLERVFQKHVVDGASYFFRKILNQPDEEYALRQDIAKACQANINDVVIVGSSKLGFSVKNHKFLEFDSKFQESNRKRDKSDIDIALVNSKFFEELTEKIYHLSNHFEQAWLQQNWLGNQYRPGPENLFEGYAKYLAKGWLRPDYMPNLILSDANWKAMCSAWTKKLDRKVSMGIYLNWKYLKHYHMDNLGILRSNILQGEK